LEKSVETLLCCRLLSPFVVTTFTFFVVTFFLCVVLIDSFYFLIFLKKISHISAACLSMLSMFKPKNDDVLGWSSECGLTNDNPGRELCAMA